MKTITRIIMGQQDAKNRKFVWWVFSDGSAISREFTYHLHYAGSVTETWKQEHEAGSEMAALIAAMPD